MPSNRSLATPMTMKSCPSSLIVDPIAPASPPKRRCHRRITHHGTCVAPSSVASRSAGLARRSHRARRSSCRKPVRLQPARFRPGAQVKGRRRHDGQAGHRRVRLRDSRDSPGSSNRSHSSCPHIGGPLARGDQGRQRRRAAATTTRSPTLKIAVFAPMPSASVRTATSVNAGVFSSIRTPNRRSCTISSSRLRITPRSSWAHRGSILHSLFSPAGPGKVAKCRILALLRFHLTSK